MLLCALLLVPAVAGAKPPKRPKPPKNPAPAGEPTPAPQGQTQPPPPPAPPAGLDSVNDKLARFQTDAARGDLGRFLDQADSNPYVAMAYGRVLDQQKKYAEAEARLRRAAELAPSDPAPWVYLGEVQLHQRRDGSEAFRKAAELARARGGAESAYYLGVAQQRLKQYDDAVATLGAAQAPMAALLPYQIGVTRAFQESWQAAAEQLSRALDMDSGLAYGYYYRALVEDKLGRKDLMVNDMERFLALAPNAPEAEQARAVLRSVKR